MMENLQVYYDVEAGVYRLLDDTEEDSGVEDLPFSTYMSAEETTLSAQMLLESERQGSLASLTPDMNYLMDEDFYTCMDDDDKDDDYKPNQSFYQPKKGKSSKHYRKHNKENNNDMSALLFTPKKQSGGVCYETGSDSSSVRHYARKDRTPRTILKMMQKHRESERVRHHSLNRAMKEVCLRVPGYDTNAKETKVIQMQRIIGYECLLENTLTDLCAQLDIPTKHLRMNTHFITDAMRDTPLDEFYKPSRFKMSDVDDDVFDNLMMRKRRVPSSGRQGDARKRHQQAPSASGRQMLKDMDENLFKYRREKISSPTVDSTTDNICQFFPTYNISNMAASQVAESSQESCFPSCLISNMAASQTAESSQDSYMTCQSFRPIKTSQGMSSQESGIKVEHSSEDLSMKAEIEDESSLHDDIETLIDQGLCREPEHLKTVTASFMSDEMVPTTTYADDDACGFDLSSPVRASQKVFMCSPRSSRDWYQPDDVDTPHGKEMQTVSPENILETKPKPAGSGSSSPLLHPGGSSPLLRPGSSSPLLCPGSSSPLLCPGSSSPLLHPGSSSPLLRPGNSSPLLHPGSSSPLLRPGNSSPLLHPGSSSPLLHPGNSSPLLHPGSSSPLLHPGSSSPLLHPGSSSPLLRPGNSSPLLHPGSSSPLLRPGNSSPLLHPGSSSPLLRPGNSSPLLHPGSSSPLLRPGSSSPLLCPGSSSPLLHPGNSSPLLHPGNSSPLLRPGSSSPLLRSGDHLDDISDLLDTHQSSYPDNLLDELLGDPLDDDRKHLGDYLDDHLGNSVSHLLIESHDKDGQFEISGTADGSVNKCLDDQNHVPAASLGHVVQRNVESNMTQGCVESNTIQKCVESDMMQRHVESGTAQKCVESSSEIVHTTPVTTTSTDNNHTITITPRTQSEETRPSLPKVYFTKDSGIKPSGFTGSNKRSHIVRLIGPGSKMGGLGLSPAGRNKRKRYLPLRSTCINSVEQGEWSDGEEPKIVRRVRRDTIQQIGNLTVYSSGTTAADGSRENTSDRPVVRSNSECPQKVDYRRSTSDLPQKVDYRRSTSDLPQKVDYRRSTIEAPQKVDYRRSTIECPTKVDYRRSTIEAPLKVDYRRSAIEAPQKVDYRRSTWMNGFMMFCQINRSKFASANPGVHNSQIQRVMGHVWRTMSPQEQAPYEEKALKCSNYVNKLQQTSPPAYTESYVDSSTAAGGSHMQLM